MRNKKSGKLLRLLLGFTLLSSLPACGTAEKEETPAPTPIPSEPAETPIPFDAIPVVPYHMEVRSFTYQDHSVYAEAFIPDNGMDSHPAVILCHGMGNNHGSVNHFAMTFAERGYFTFTFDFCGGCEDCESSGTLLDMSILTEAEDLDAVIDHVKAMPEVNSGYLFLLGQSQGGVVASIEASRRRDEIAGLILMYPAYNVQNLTKEMFPDPEKIPAAGEIYDQTVSRKYFLDALSVDFPSVMKSYDKEVLILHGSEDTTVPLSYSKTAAETFPSADLTVVSGAGHGFDLPDAPLVDGKCMSYLLAHTPEELAIAEKQ